MPPGICHRPRQGAPGWIGEIRCLFAWPTFEAPTTLEHFRLEVGF